MAAKKTTTALAQRPTIIKTRAPAPIIIRETRTAAAPKKKHHTAKHSNGGGSKASTMDAMLGAGGLALLEKSSMANMIPVMPVGGRAASVGLLLYFVGGKYRRYASGPLAIATYTALGGVAGGGAVVGGFGPGVAAVM